MSNPIQILIRTEVVGGTSSGLSGLTTPGRTRRVASYRTSPWGGFNRLPVAVAEKALRAGTINYGTLQGPVVDAAAQPVKPTYTVLQNKCNCELGVPEHRALREQVDYLLDAARVNANMTVYEERAQPESEWPALFLGSLAVHLSSGVPQEVADWFKRHGVTY